MALSPDGQHMICDEPDCNNMLRNHAWGRIKADGWMQQKDGTLWCPDHLPDWVEKWRKNRGPAKQQG